MTSDGVKVTFGVRYRDKWSGLVGIATARTEYPSSEPNVCLEWRANDGSLKETWIKEDRLRQEPSEPTGVYV